MMKSFFKKLAFVMALAMVVSLAAPAATTAAAAENMKITYQNGKSGISELNIAEVGAKEDLKALNAPKNWKELGMKWESSNPAVATVNNSGEVEAKAAGTAVITVTCGDATASVTVYCVDTQTYKVTMGTSKDNLLTEANMEVGGKAIDFAFFGIKDYDQDRYHCTWASTDTSVIKVNAKNGYTEAVGAGTAKVTLIAFNKTTGEVHDVAPCTVTVGTPATPTPAKNPEIVAVQKSEDSFELTFKDMKVDLEKLAKNEIEVYEYHVDENYDIEQLYIWQIASVTPVKDSKDTVVVQGYGTNELVDGQKYVVKYVVPNADEEKVETIKETTFVASVGAVDRIAVSYGSYPNNQDYWTFPGVAYTNENYGEEILVNVDYRLYDDENIDVTDHYLRLNDWKNLVTLDLVTEEAEDTFEIVNEQENYLVFDELPESPYVVFNVVYEDEDGEEVIEELKMIVKEAPAYHVTSIDKYQINIDDTLNNVTDDDGTVAANNKYWLKDWVALYDDYDVNDMDPLGNHEIVIWFTDNYGNKYVTKECFAKNGSANNWNEVKVDGNRYEYYMLSEKFSNEGFEFYYETKNPQTLVVGDEYDDLTTSNVITTKKTGTATINVSLHDEDGLVDRIDNLRIVVKAQRYLKSAKVNTSSAVMTSDSIADGADALDYTDSNGFHTVVRTDGRAGNNNEYDGRWTKKEVVLTVTDNHGAAFGAYNKTLLVNFEVETVAPDSTDLTAIVAAFDEDNYDAEHGTLKYTLYGPDVANALNATTGETTVTKAEVEIKITDGSNEKELEDDFKVVLKQPNYHGTTGISNIKIDDKVVFTANGTYGYVNTPGLVIPITVVETSNKLSVNYCDDVILLNTTTIPSTATAGEMYLYVTDPKGRVVPTTGQFYIDEVETGYYEFKYADTKSGNAGTRFATTGTYTVKLVTIGDNGQRTTKTEKFKLVDDRLEFSYVDQKYIYVSDDTLEDFEGDGYDDNGNDAIQEIAANAFSYWNNTLNRAASFGSAPVLKEVGGVRFTENADANAVVIKDVFFKVYIDFNGDSDWADACDYDFWYYVEVEIPDGKTVSVETLNNIGTSTKYRLDPDMEKIQ